MRWLVLAFLLGGCAGAPTTDATTSSRLATADAGAVSESGGTDDGDDDDTPSDGEDDGEEAEASFPIASVEEPEPPPGDVHRGEATYFPPGPRGACGSQTPTSKLVGALGGMYSRANCGRCAKVTGPKGAVTVVINDRCAACKGASMDLSTAAFTQIAEKTDGRVRIKWHYVACR